MRTTETQSQETATLTFTKTTPPEWLLAFWKEIDDKTFGRGFDCLAEDAVCNFGAADWRGREKIRENMRAFVDAGFTRNHEIVEYWDSPSLKIFHGTVQHWASQIEARLCADQEVIMVGGGIR